MKTDSVFCSLSKKCKEQYSKEVSENLSKEVDKLEEVLKNNQNEDEEK